MSKRFGKNDLIFIGVLLAAATVLLLFMFLGKGAGSSVVVTVDGTVYGVYDLARNQEIPISNSEGVVTNQLVIRDGVADMVDADCPDRLCVKQRAIRREGENLVCLPNRVVVMVESDKESGLDGFAQ